MPVQVHLNSNNENFSKGMLLHSVSRSSSPSLSWWRLSAFRPIYLSHWAGCQMQCVLSYQHRTLNTRGYFEMVNITPLWGFLKLSNNEKCVARSLFWVPGSVAVTRSFTGVLTVSTSSIGLSCSSPGGDISPLEFLVMSPVLLEARSCITPLT